MINLYTRISALFLFLFLLFSIESQAVDLGIEGITPIGIAQSGSLDIEVIIANFDGELMSECTIKWTVTTPDKMDADLDNESKVDINKLGVNESDKFKIGSYNFEKDKIYLIIAEIDEISSSIPGLIPSDNNSKNDKYYQLVGEKYADGSLFIIDSPSPKSSNTADGIYATVINYGPNPLRSTYIRWIYQTAEQNQVVNPNDTTNALIFPKLNAWDRAFFVFDPPIDSGYTAQVKVGNLGSGDVLIVATSQANGLPDNQADDTSRVYISSTMLGKYSISVDDSYKAQFTSINEAIEYLYSQGFYTDEPDKAIDGFGGGVQFYARPGTYKGTIELSGNFKNGSIKNSMALQGFTSDSSAYIIEADASDNFALKLNNVQHFSLKGLNYKPQKDGHVILITGEVNNFVVSSSILNGTVTSSLSTDYSVVIADGAKLDSCNLLDCVLLDGSYGVYYSGSASNKMHTVGVADCIFVGQTNAAISYSNHSYSFISNNTINDNRIEFMDSHVPIVVGNRINITKDISSKIGRGYSSGVKLSGIGVIRCDDTLIVVQNNICVNTPNTYGLHIKDSKNNSTELSKINNNSLQSITKSLFIENSSNLMLSNLSADLKTGKADDKAALYIDAQSSKIILLRNHITSTSGGYGIITGSKTSIVEGDNPKTAINNFYSASGAFAKALDGGTYSTVQDFFHYLGIFPINSVSVDPEYYDNCDLISCNSQTQYGYMQCNKVNAPQYHFPVHNTENHQLNVNFIWTENQANQQYQLQVSKSADFGMIEGKIIDEISAFGDLIYDKSNINNNYATVYGLELKTDYYWRVRVCCGTSRSPWSETYSFKTLAHVSVEWGGEELNNLSHIPMEIYPNPGNSVSSLMFHLSESTFVSLEVLDYLGNTVLTRSIGNLEQGTHNIQLAPLPAGMYFVVLKSMNKTGNTKFIQY